VARRNILAALDEGLLAGHTVFVRVNDRESGHLLRDVLALAVPGVTGFVYPKSRSGQDVYFFDKLLETVEAERGLPPGTFAVVPLIETTAAVLHAEDICRASPRVAAIAFGCEDFLADLGGLHDEAGRSLFTARSLIALAARPPGCRRSTPFTPTSTTSESWSGPCTWPGNWASTACWCSTRRRSPWCTATCRRAGAGGERSRDGPPVRGGGAPGPRVAILDGKFVGPPTAAGRPPHPGPPRAHLASGEAPGMNAAAPGDGEPRPDFSVVVPVYNSEPSLEELFRRLDATFTAMGRSFEVVFVDDGSRDGSLGVLRSLHSRYPGRCGP